MKKNSIILILLCVFILLSTFTCFASYDNETHNIQPRYSYINSLTAGLSGQSGFVSVFGSVTVTDPTLTCKLNVQLQEKENGTWTTISTWNASGAFSVSISKNYYVLAGEYRTKVNANIYNSSNLLVETAYAYYPG